MKAWCIFHIGLGWSQSAHLRDSLVKLSLIALESMSAYFEEQASPSNNVLSLMPGVFGNACLLVIPGFRAWLFRECKLCHWQTYRGISSSVGTDLLDLESCLDAVRRVCQLKNLGPGASVREPLLWSVLLASGYLCVKADRGVYHQVKYKFLMLDGLQRNGHTIAIARGVTCTCLRYLMIPMIHLMCWTCFFPWLQKVFVCLLPCLRQGIMGKFEAA
jgi:hypothetical protein